MTTPALYAFHLPEQKLGGLLRSLSRQPRIFRLTANELQVFTNPERASPAKLARLVRGKILFDETATCLLNCWFALTWVRTDLSERFIATWRCPLPRIEPRSWRFGSHGFHPSSGEGKASDSKLEIENELQELQAWSSLGAAQSVGRRAPWFTLYDYDCT